MRVLLVEDEPYMAEAIRDGLRLEAIAADIAGDGDTALELLSVNSYDIAVLDRDIRALRRRDRRTHRRLRQRHADPHAHRRRPSRRQGHRFELGADDYLNGRSSSESSCSVSERSTAGAPTTGHPCERSRVYG